MKVNRSLSTVFACVSVLFTASALAECGGEWQERWQGFQADLIVDDEQACSIGRFELLLARPDGEQHRLISQREGTVQRMWVTDLNKDSRAEVIIAFTSVGSGSYGHLQIYSSRASHLARWPEPPLPEELKPKYQGGDRYLLTDDRLLRYYRDADGIEVNLVLSVEDLTWKPRGY